MNPPKEKAIDLVNQYRMILMNEDTDCGCEILCTSIAIKNALVAVGEIIDAIDWHDFDTPNKQFNYWYDVKKELTRL